MPLHLADPSLDPAAEPTLPERFNSYVEEALGLENPLPSWSIYAAALVAAVGGYAAYNKLVAGTHAFAGIPGLETLSNPKKGKKGHRKGKGKSKAKASSKRGKGKGKGKGKTSRSRKASPKSGGRTAWQRFFAKHRKAGKTAKQIGRLWRNRK